MSEKKYPLEDPFFAERLNPFFLDTLQNYWEILEQSTIEEADLEKKKLAQQNLIHFALFRLFQPLYLQHIPKIEGRVFFLSKVHSDGLGDFFSLLKSAKIIKKAHPHLNVDVVYIHQTLLPKIRSNDYFLKDSDIHPFQETDHLDSQILEAVLEGKVKISFESRIQELYRENNEFQDILSKQNKQNKNILEIINEIEIEVSKLRNYEQTKKRAETLYQEMIKSLALVHIALGINTFENPLLASKSFYFSETGNFPGITNLLNLKWFSMGLLPFEEGIFLKPLEFSREWRHTTLPIFLWGTHEPTQKDLTAYLQNHIFAIGYLPQIPKQLEIFVYLICLKHKGDSKCIDIVLPFSQKANLNLNLFWLSQQGIGEVLLIHCHDNNLEVYPASNVENNGKTLRIIFALPMPQSDFFKCMALGDQIVGCTGDGSISDCLSLKKVPLYEIRKHKFKTIEAFEKLAIFLKLYAVEQYFKTASDFENYPSELVSKHLFEILENPSFKKEWHILTIFIERYFCFEDSLVSHLNRHFYFTLKPQLKKEENLLYQNFISTKNSAADIYKKMKNCLKF